MSLTTRLLPSFNSSYFHSQQSQQAQFSFIDKVKEILKARESLAPKNLKTGTITLIDKWDQKLDHLIPNNRFQQGFDDFRYFGEKDYAEFAEFNKRLDSNGHGEWHSQLATFLCKLPLRAARNIAAQIYFIIKEAIYAAVHPLKALNRLARLLVNLVAELTKPEVWSKIGAGMIGGSLGAAAVGNPISLIVIGIGTALLIGGLSIGALKASLIAEKGEKFEAIIHNLWDQTKQLPECMLTSFLLAFIIVGFEKYMRSADLTYYHVRNYDEAKRFADAFIKEHNLPQYTHLELKPTQIRITWEESEICKSFEKIFPKHVFDWPYGGEFTGEIPKVSFHLSPPRYNSSIWVTTVRGHPPYSPGHFVQFHDPSYYGFNGRLYPLPPERTLLKSVNEFLYTNQLVASAINSKEIMS